MIDYIIYGGLIIWALLLCMTWLKVIFFSEENQDGCLLVTLTVIWWMVVLNLK